MDNVCIFMDWVIRGDVAPATLTSNGTPKKIFKASSPRPAKDGTWNSHLFVAWGETAKKLEEFQIGKGTHIIINATEQPYTDKEGKKQSTFLVNNFQIIGAIPKKTETEEKKPETATEPELPQGDIDGYDALMAEFN